MEGIVLESHNRTTADGDVRRRLRHGEHITKDWRMLGKNAPVNAKSSISCNKHDVSVVVPELL